MLAGRTAPSRVPDVGTHVFEGIGLELHRIGDCLVARQAHAATIEAERVGLAL